jgi:hypothetical protein
MRPVTLRVAAVTVTLLALTMTIQLSFGLGKYILIKVLVIHLFL